MIHVGAGWLTEAVTPHLLDQTVKKLAKALRKHSKDFDTIVFRGLSGALVAPMLALKMKKNMLAIRKPNDGSHSNYKCEGNIDIKKYIILDDFVDSGKTVQTIVEDVDSAFKSYNTFAYERLEIAPTLVGLALYRRSNDWAQDDKAKCEEKFNMKIKFAVGVFEY